MCKKMMVVGMCEAKTHLSHLIKEAGEKGSIQIARNGKVVAEVRPLTGKFPAKLTLGGLRGKMKVPQNFDEVGQKEIERAFHGE